MGLVSMHKMLFQIIVLIFAFVDSSPGKHDPSMDIIVFLRDG